MCGVVFSLVDLFKVDLVKVDGAVGRIVMLSRVLGGGEIG